MAINDKRPSASKPKLRPMPKLIWDPDYWSFRAEEARTIQSGKVHPECRRSMNDIAASYDCLAKLNVEFREAALAAGAPKRENAPVTTVRSKYDRPDHG